MKSLELFDAVFAGCFFVRNERVVAFSGPGQRVEAFAEALILDQLHNSLADSLHLTLSRFGRSFCGGGRTSAGEVCFVDVVQDRRSRIVRGVELVQQAFEWGPGQRFAEAIVGSHG